MTASTLTSNVTCNFCGLTQAATQPHCVGCGAALPLKAGEQQTNGKLLELATQMNTILASENARIKGESRLRRLRVAVGLVCVGCVMASVVWSFSSSYSVVFDEEAMMQQRPTAQNAAHQRYTRALEMELFNSQGRLPEAPSE